MYIYIICVYYMYIYIWPLQLYLWICTPLCLYMSVSGRLSVLLLRSLLSLSGQRNVTLICLRCDLIGLTGVCVCVRKGEQHGLSLYYTSFTQKSMGSPYTIQVLLKMTMKISALLLWYKKGQL